jgi:hypothetical protein
MRFLRKLLGETDAIEEAKREAGDDLEGGQVQAPESATMPEDPDEAPDEDLPERSSPEG